MKKQNKKIWIYAEGKDGKLTKVFTELLCKSRKLEASEVSAVLLGSEPVDMVAQIAATGVDRIYVMDHPVLKNYGLGAYKTALCQMIQEHRPDVVLFGATATGSELAPSVAAKLRIGLAAHCVDITARDDGETAYWVPAFGGNVIGEILIPDHSPEMASVKPGILTAEEYEKNLAPEITYVEARGLDALDTGVTLLGFEEKVSSGQSLEDAEVVLCGGRGISNEQIWGQLKEIAVKMGAAVGYTRSLIDRGFIEDESSMIGTSGKVVTPKIYISFGVSGATHHVCGMNKSKTVISVNKDAKAKIFDVSDYKSVAKAEDVLTAMSAILEARNG